MRSIGTLATDSGLTVSALRFYDARGVLPPDVVDPVTGYRWYGTAALANARLIARLRRVGMPLAGIRAVLAARTDPAAVRTILDTHVRRLEDGLADARRELSAVQALIEAEEHIMPITRCTLDGAEVAAAIEAVRFAVGTDPQLPAIAGVLLEVEGEVLRLVATDRYRLAVASAGLRTHTGPQVSTIAPTALVDDIAATLTDEPVTLEFDGADINASSGAARVSGARVDQDFPDYRRLVAGESGRRVPVSAAALRHALAEGPVRTVTREQDNVTCDVAVLHCAEGGALTVIGDGGELADDEAIGVNREFLLQALAASATDQLVLDLDGPIRPLAIRSPETPGRFSILMPTRLSA